MREGDKGMNGIQVKEDWEKGEDTIEINLNGL
jgi:hypothetical protein